MSQQQTEIKHIIGVDPMGCCRTLDEPVDLSDPYMVKVGVTFDASIGATLPTYDEKINLVEMTQTYKDLCGMALAQKLIKQGVDPANFADDGQHSGDTTDPTLASAQAVANAAIQRKETVAEIKRALGLPEDAEGLGDDILSTLVAKVIEEKYPDIIQQQPASSGNKDGGAE